MRTKGYEKLIKKLLDHTIPYFSSLNKILQTLHQKNELKKLVCQIEKNYSSLNTFRILIMIDRVINEQEVNFSQWIQILKSLKSEAKSYEDSLIEEKIINPYKLFLQKYCEYRIQELDGFISMDKEVEIFKCINLLWSAASFLEIIFIFGRYYPQFHAEIIEFNIAICISLQKIYIQLSRKIDYFSKRQILAQVQLLHEKLYIAFYNCYFYPYVKHYCPTWIKTDQLDQQKVPSNKHKNFHQQQQSTYSQRNKSKLNETISTFHSKNHSLSNTKFENESVFLLSYPKENIEIIQLQDDFLQSQDHTQSNQERLELIREMQQIVLMIND